mgnify:CR=1 FL=1
MEPSDDHYIVHFRTAQATQVKALMDVLKDLLSEATLRFDAEGFTLVTMDPSHVGMIHLRVNRLEHYKGETFNAGVDIPYLYKILRSATGNHHLEGYVLWTNPEVLHLKLENADKRTHVLHHIKLLDLPVETITIPEVDFDLVLSMPCAELQRAVKELDHVSNILTVRCQGNVLQFLGSGDHGETCVEIAPSPSGLTWVHRDPLVETFEGSFFLRYVSKFSRGSVDPTVQIFLRHKFPLILRFQLTIGSLRFCVAPKTDQ